MEVAAKHKFARISPQKCRLVVDQIRGLPVEQAIQADIDELKVSRTFVDEGPTMKRIQARAKGRANRILKRTSHITVMVADR